MGDPRNLVARPGPFFSIPAATVVAIFTVSKLKLQQLSLSVAGDTEIQSAVCRATQEAPVVFLYRNFPTFKSGISISHWLFRTEFQKENQNLKTDIGQFGFDNVNAL